MPQVPFCFVETSSLTLTVLSVAYPFSPVSSECAGGAEQIVGMLDWGLTAAGYRSIVLACEGSRGAGTLVTAGKIPDRIDDAARSSAWSRWRSAIEDCLERWRVDLLHLHGLDFHRYLPAGGPTKL